MKTDWYLDYFQGIIVDLWQQAVSPEQTRSEVEFVLDLMQLSPASRLLDVPCGFGRHAIELAARGFSVTGVDVSADCLARARKRAVEQDVLVHWIQCEMRQLPQDEPFDGAICLGNSLGYFDYDGTVAFLTKLAGALRPGARLVLESGAIAESILPNLKPRAEYAFGSIFFVDERDYDPAHSRIQSTNTITVDGKT